MVAIGKKIKNLTVNNLEIIIIYGLFYWMSLKIPFKGIEYSYFYYLIDYHFGFVKRGLIGEIFSISGVKIDVYKVLAFNKLLFLLFGILIICIIKKINFKNKIFEIIIFFFILFNPALLKNYWLDLGRFDIYGAIVTCLMIISNKKTMNFLFVFSPLLLMVHEAQLVLFIPSIIFIWFLRNNLLSIKNKIIFGVFALFLVITIILTTIYGESNASISNLKQYMDYKNNSDYNYFFESNLYSGNTFVDIKNSIIFNLKHFKLFILGGISLVYSAYILSRFSYILDIQIEGRKMKLLILILIINFSIFLLGLDGYRWISNITFSLLFNFLAILSTLEIKQLSINEIFENEKKSFIFLFMILSFIIISLIPYLGITAI